MINYLIIIALITLISRAIHCYSWATHCNMLWCIEYLRLLTVVHWLLGAVVNRWSEWLAWELRNCLFLTSWQLLCRKPCINVDWHSHRFVNPKPYDLHLQNVLSWYAIIWRERCWESGPSLSRYDYWTQCIYRANKYIPPNN